MNPIVSVIIPCFNNSSTIVETILSVYSQSLQSFEIILVNDGSTDPSYELVASFKEEHSKDNLHLLSQENKGPSSARNNGASIAKGKYLLFLDADDKIHPTYLEKSVRLLENDESLHIVYCEADYFDGVNKRWRLPSYSKTALLLENSIFISAIIRKKTFDEAGQFDETLQYNEDWDLWIRITSIIEEKSVYKINEPLFYYRKNRDENSLTDNRTEKEEKARLQIYLKHYELYKQAGFDIISLMTSKRKAAFYKRKYYAVWYRRLFYKLFKKKSLDDLMK